MSFGLRNNGVPRDEIDRRVRRASEILHLGELLHRKPAQLSGGQRQRVAIGRALVREAAVFLFDEPLSNLDAKLRTELRRELKQLHRELRSTMIYVTHDQVEAMTLASRIAVMKDGRIQQIDTPSAIYQRPVNMFVAGFLGAPGMNFIEGRLSVQGSRVTARCAALEVDVSDYGFVQRPADAQAVVLGIRPEHLQLQPPQADGATARVCLVEPMGAHLVVWLALGGLSLAVQCDTSQAFDTDAAVTLQVDAKQVSLFDPSTQQRL
jgi:multiple sugar transport system ATP-binding protein